MAKLKLDLDRLQVQSFATTVATGIGQGTVIGQSIYPDTAEPTTCDNGDTCWWTCGQGSCDPPYTCEECVGTEGPSCGGSAVSHDPTCCTCGPTESPIAYTCNPGTSFTCLDC
jgi:hypothetical protein